MSSALLRKWQRWLKRIRDEQLSDLLINKHIFKQLCDCTVPYAGTCQSSELAGWMKQCYIAFAATAVRRMLEEPAHPPKPKRCPKCDHIIVTPKPKKSLSLIALLRDIEQSIEKNPSLFTRSWFRKLYTDENLPNQLADRDFNKITRRKSAKTLSASRVRRDIDALYRIACPVRRLVNKAIAHTSLDRRKVGCPKYKQLNDAIRALTDTYEIYWLLIFETEPIRLMPPGSYNVTDDFNKIWPSRCTAS